MPREPFGLNQLGEVAEHRPRDCDMEGELGDILGEVAVDRRFQWIALGYDKEPVRVHYATVFLVRTYKPLPITAMRGARENAPFRAAISSTCSLRH